MNIRVWEVQLVQSNRLGRGLFPLNLGGKRWDKIT